MTQPQDQELKNRGYIVDRNQRLGSGAFSVVYKGYKESVNSNREPQKETLAIKEIILEETAEDYEDLYKHSKRELEIMMKLKSRNNKNIINLIDYIEFEVEQRRVTGIIKRKVIAVKYRHIYFIMEYCDMSLQGYLEKYGGRLNPEEMKVFFRQIRNGLEALHQDENMKILHRDLKPDNILLKMDDVGIKESDDETEKRKKYLKATLKIADFGLSKICNKTDTCRIGTPMYMAPEVIFTRDDYYDPNADMWCIGIMLYRCLTGRLPYPTQISTERLKAYFESIEDEESLVDNDLRPIGPTNDDENEVFRLNNKYNKPEWNNDPEWKNKKQELSDWKDLIRKLLKIQIQYRMNFETFKKHPFVYNLIEGEIKLEYNRFSFNIAKKSAIQENSHIDEDDPNFFRHCMVEKFSLYTYHGIDEDLQLIKQKFDGKLLVQHLRIIQEYDSTINSVFNWAEKLPEVFEFAEYSTLSLRVSEENFNYIVNNPPSIRFELIKSINVELMRTEWMGAFERRCYQTDYLDELDERFDVYQRNLHGDEHIKILNFVFNQDSGENRECLMCDKIFNYNLLKEFMQTFCQLFETNSKPECIFKEVRLIETDYGKKIYESGGCPVKWHEFLKNLGFINVGYEAMSNETIQEKSRTDGWKLRILWSEDIDYEAKDTTKRKRIQEGEVYSISLMLKIGKEFLRPIKGGYFFLHSDGNVYVGDEKLENGKDIVEHRVSVRGTDEFNIMPLTNFKRYRFENVIIGQGVLPAKVEKLHEWVKKRGAKIPVVNLYLRIDTLHDKNYISVHSLPNFEFSMLKLTLLRDSDFDELAKNPSVIDFPSANSININVTTVLRSTYEPSREYDKFLNFIFNSKCINLGEIYFFENIIDFTEEFVKGFIERFNSTTNLEYAWKSVRIDVEPVFWKRDQVKNQESVKCSEYLKKMINEWDNILNNLHFQPSDGEISEEHINWQTVHLLWKSHVLEAEHGWKLKILSSRSKEWKRYFWKFQIYK